MTPEQQIYDAARAKEVLENPAFEQAFDTIRQEYTQAWQNSPARDAEGRESLYLMIRLTNKLQATLTGMLENGKMASINLEQEAAYLASQRAFGVSIG